MAATSSSSTLRQELVARLAAAVATVLGPGVTVQALGDKAVAVRLDGGVGGTGVTHVARWLPAFTRRRD